jgi:hypothetical protein
MRTLSEDMDDWLELHEWPFFPLCRLAPPAPVMQLRSADCVMVPPCPLSDQEIDWLWPRYAACSFPPATFAKRFAGCAREKLTPRGKNAAVSLGYRYRRQIFGKRAVLWSDGDFLLAVRKAAAVKSPTTAEA